MNLIKPFIVLVMMFSLFMFHIPKASAREDLIIFIGDSEEGSFWQQKLSAYNISIVVKNPDEAQEIANNSRVVLIGNNTVVNYNITSPVIAFGSGGAEFLETWRGVVISYINFFSQKLNVSINTSVSGHPIFNEISYEPNSSKVGGFIRWIENGIKLAHLNYSTPHTVVSSRSSFVLFGLENGTMIEDLNLIPIVVGAIRWLSRRPVCTVWPLFASDKDRYVVGETMHFSVSTFSLDDWQELNENVTFLFGEKNLCSVMAPFSGEYRFIENVEKLSLKIRDYIIDTNVSALWRDFKMNFTINSSTFSYYNGSLSERVSLSCIVLDENNTLSNATVIYAFAPRILKITDVLDNAYFLCGISTYTHTKETYLPDIPHEWRLWAIIPANECGVNISYTTPVYFQSVDIDVYERARIIAYVEESQILVWVAREGRGIPFLTLRILDNSREYSIVTNKTGYAAIERRMEGGKIEIESAVPAVITEKVVIDVQPRIDWWHLLEYSIAGAEIIGILLITLSARKRVNSVPTPRYMKIENVVFR